MGFDTKTNIYIKHLWASDVHHDGSMFIIRTYMRLFLNIRVKEEFTIHISNKIYEYHMKVIIDQTQGQYNMVLPLCHEWSQN